MIGKRTLKQSFVTSHVLVSLVPLGFIAIFLLLFLIRSVQDDSIVKIDMLAQGTKGQIQLFLDQPMAVMRGINEIIFDETGKFQDAQKILNTHANEYPYFEAVYLLNRTGQIVDVGLPRERRHYRQELMGINLGHKAEFHQVLQTGILQWSDTFLSLSSGKISLTIYAPAGDYVLAADINLNALAQLINRLSRDAVVTIVIDKNGAIIFHPDADLVGKSIMVNDIALVTSALQGREETGEFTFQGSTYIGSTGIIEPAGWISLIAEPKERQNRRLVVPLLIFAAGLGGAAVLSLLLALYRARSLSRPLTEITAKSSVIAQGDYSASLPGSRIAELEQLADSINHMVLAIRKREDQLLVNQKKYRELVENTSNLVLRLDHNFFILYANHTIERLTGISSEQAHGMRLSNFMTEDVWREMADQITFRIRERKESENLETHIRHLDGTLRNLLLSINLHYSETGVVDDMNIIGHDITARYQIERQKREMEKQRQQSQKMELLGLMAGGVAHDLNNILAGVINYPEILLLNMEEDNPQRHLIESIKKSGERAAAVVADLLTVARRSASVLEVVDINVLVTEYCSSPEFKKLEDLHSGVAFDLETSPTLWYCLCSSSHIEKTIMNLVTNGFEAVEKNGRVSVKTENVSSDELKEHGIPLEPGQYIAIKVKDSGKGIGRDDLDKVFEPFFSKKGLGRSGTGLGLSVAWSSVKEHGGTITVESGEEGTLFTVYLPATSEPPPVHLEQEDISDFDGNGEHILVVDDEEHLREIAANMLGILKYRVSAVAGGEDALAFLKKEKVDLVLLDMLMEPGLSGKETYEKISTFLPGQPALIASGFSESSDIEAALRLGVGGFIRKPYSITELGRSISQVLRKKGEAEGSGAGQPRSGLPC